MKHNNKSDQSNPMLIHWKKHNKIDISEKCYQKKTIKINIYNKNNKAQTFQQIKNIRYTFIAITLKV